MSSSSSSSSSGGIGFVGLLTILFVALKLLEVTQVATWSWWWVLSPVWITTAIVVGVLAIIFGIVFIAEWKKL